MGTLSRYYQDIPYVDILNNFRNAKTPYLNFKTMVERKNVAFGQVLKDAFPYELSRESVILTQLANRFPAVPWVFYHPSWQTVFLRFHALHWLMLD